MFFTVQLDVEDGNNVVEVFAANSYNAESCASISFVGDVRKAPPDLWLVAIGVNDYNASLIHDLSYAVNDAKVLVNVFKKQEGRCYGKVNVLLLADGERQKPTAAAVRESFAWFKQAKDRDLCVLFIAGHAVNDSKGDYYFLPSDAAFDASGNLNTKTAISHLEIISLLDMPGKGSYLPPACYVPQFYRIIP
ncbi:caspase family protein [Treponema sp. R8-4-B8]